jgi:hypothetical protein
MLLCSAGLEAAPIPVRFAEGVARGFLSIRSPDGAKLAEGDLLQVPRATGIESRLIFHFQDGSLYDETVVFSQQRVFTLLRYRLVQRGPAFPKTLEVSFDRKTGQYEFRSREGKEAHEEHLSGRLELPPDVYNGMMAMLLKNLPRGAGDTIHIVSFTPKPRLMKMHLTPAGEAAVRVGDQLRQTTQYLVKPQLGGFYGFLATLTGKELPVFRYWILRGEVPAFVKFEGPFFMGGPTWRVGSSYRTDSHGDDPQAAVSPRARRK